MAVMFAAVGAGSFQGGGQLSAHSILWLQQAKVCSDPGVPCRTSIKFEAYDLPFQVPKNAVIWETEKFYAIILKSVATEGDCDRFVSEDDRLKAQALFPNAKVF